MAFSCYVGSITQKATTGTQAYTGVGFQPKAMLFWSDGQTATGLLDGDGRICVGMAVSSTSRASIAGNSEDNHATGNVDGRHDNTHCILLLNASATVIGSADLDSFDADGFTLDWTVADGSAYIIYYMALGGDALTNVAIKQLQSATSLGAVGYTGVGFQPDCLIAMSSGIVAAPPANDARVNVALGWATSSSVRGAIGIASRQTDPSQTDHGVSTGHLINQPFGHALQIQADLDSMDADGFTLDWTDIDASARYCWVLCLKGGNYWITEITQKTSTGNQAYTGAGFTPTGVLLATARDTTDSANEGEADLGFGGASSSSAEGCICYLDENGSTTRKTWRANASASCIELRPTNDGSLSGAASLNSFDSNGLTLNWTTSNGVASTILLLAFGDASVTAKGPPPFQNRYRIWNRR